MKIKEMKMIEKIKSYLYNFDHEKYYGDIEFEGKTYKASNLLFSLLISETLNTKFKYFEDINIGVFEDTIRKHVLSNYNDENSRKAVLRLLKEIMDINSYVVKMNTTTFSYHDLLSNNVDLSDIRDNFIDNANNDMRFSLELLNKSEKETLNRFREVKSDFTRLIDSKARGNQKQIAQEFLSIGYKVDNKSNILPKPIHSSFFSGLSSIEEMFIAAVGCRNAIIQGTNSVADSGYLNRKLSFGSVDIILSDTKDCGTQNYLLVDINNSNKNIILNGRYIYDDEDNKLKLINSLESNKYVGKRVKLRSPATCSCKDGICRTCYGIMSKVNDGLSIGLLAATIIAEIATQKLLSTKHLLFASIQSDNPMLMEYIHINHEENGIFCTTDINIKVDSLEKILFIVNDEEIEYLHNFKNLKFSKEPDHTDDNGDRFYNFKKGDLIFTDIQKYVCSDMNVLMKKLNRVFDKSGYMKEVNDYNIYFRHLFDVIMELGYVPSIHIEVVFSQMLKVKDDHHLLFRHNQNSPYDIVSIRKSNLSNNLFNSILFERVKESITKLSNYDIKDIQETKYEKLFGKF